MSHPYKARPVGASVDWLTPPQIIEALGPFDLDPCCPPLMPWATAKRMLTLCDDGLRAEWKGRVWLNPPYGRETRFWLQKLANHGNGITVVFARTETAMFFESVWPKCDAIFFIKGRPKFCGKDGKPSKGNSGGPLVLVAYGQDNVKAIQDSKIPGKLLILRKGG